MKRFGEIDGVPVQVTLHSLERMVEMKITPEHFKQMICEPDEVRISKKYKDVTYRHLGRYTMVTRPQQGVIVVITFLFTTLEEWIKADQEGLLVTRELRLDCGARPR